MKYMLATVSPYQCQHERSLASNCKIGITVYQISGIKMLAQY